MAIFRYPPNLPGTPKKVKPVLVYENDTPDRGRTTYSSRQVFGDLCSNLEKFEEQGWEVHTVERRHTPAVGDHYWVLLRKPGVNPRGPFPARA